MAEEAVARKVVPRVDRETIRILLRSHDLKPRRKNNCATANIFGIVEPNAGRHFTHVTPDRSGYQFALAIRDLIAAATGCGGA